jgi:hypothetical protein
VWVESASRRDGKWRLGGRVERQMEVIWCGVEGRITMREENVWQDKGRQLLYALGGLEDSQTLFLIQQAYQESGRVRFQIDRPAFVSVSALSRQHSQILGRMFLH